MNYTEKSIRLINYYNRFQQEKINNFKENNEDIDPEFYGILDDIIANHKELFTSDANYFLSELNSELVETEEHLGDIKLAMELTKIFIQVIARSDESYFDSLDINSGVSNDVISLIKLIKQYG